jgi:hypothetical protein
MLCAVRATAGKKSPDRADRVTGASAGFAESDMCSPNANGSRRRRLGGGERPKGRPRAHARGEVQSTE